MYTINTICHIIKGRLVKQYTDVVIEHLIYDSRLITSTEGSLFFALHTPQRDGHYYIEEAFKKGIRNFVVDKEVKSDFVDCNIIKVADTLKALHQLAANHRNNFNIPVISITGSNGKTIVKEWLYQLLQDDHAIVRSPKSFNSQLGVPLSVWQINSTHELAIIEAGISKAGEIDSLEKIIKPTIGVFTNLGQAHDEGFLSQDEKLREKIKLFQNSDIVIGQNKYLEGFPKNKKFTWGKSASNNLQIISIETSYSSTVIHGSFLFYPTTVTIPFIDEASIENAINCWCVMLYLEYNEQTINERFSGLHSVDMRLQLGSGINHCTIINDSYSADLTSLQIALHFLLQQHTVQKRTIILSDFVETGKPDEKLYELIAHHIIQNKVEKVIAVGKSISSHLPALLPPAVEVNNFYSTEDFIKNFKQSHFVNEIILVKGARQFQFEKIVQMLETKVHQTLLQIDLNAIAHNLKDYRKLLKPATKIMAMVKAFSYGSGGAEIANILQFNNIDYLGVAYADEGVALKEAGVSIPVMVMNAEESSFLNIINHNLQPVLYSLFLLRKFESFLNQQGIQGYPVHLEIETGMNRLGFTLHDCNLLKDHFKEGGAFKIQSVFSHLVASEDAAQDDFTIQQASVFSQAIEILQQIVSYPFLKHISNSAAIIRHPQLHMDMVRLGIGLYGVEIETKKLNLQPVATLRSTIAQIRNLHAGDTVSYNRTGILKEDTVIATVRIGYADGYSRIFSNGTGKMLINGKLAPVVGSVCMDMTMINITGIEGVKEGDEVFVFGKSLPVAEVAAWANTIPYELMTSVSQRVKRIYYQE
ncbi:MAG: bifunctional UDP-N-acetylmuramoyl-tripeptide:D-alanyl-D-alanine ligase/alanine racemase [Chitinophagaceae bacterium]